MSSRKHPPEDPQQRNIFQKEKLHCKFTVMDAGINFGDVMLSSLHWNKSSLWKSLFKIMLAIHRILILNEQVKGVLDSEVTIFLDHLSCFWKQLWPSRMLYSLWQFPSESSSCVLPVTAKSVNDFSAKMPNQTLAVWRLQKKITSRKTLSLDITYFSSRSFMGYFNYLR